MERLTVVRLGPARFPGDPETGEGWPDEGFEEYAEHSLTHDDQGKYSRELPAAS
jgi:hypothetical protein